MESKKEKEKKEKKTVKKEELKKEVKSSKPEKYYEAVGRRKSAVARVRLYSKRPLKPGSPLELLINNNKSLKDYFPFLEHQLIAVSPLKLTKNVDRFNVLVKVRGGGPKAQAEAVRHGLARALVIFNQNFKKRLKRAGFLRRDPRVKERKKPGLKKARRAPQWRKR